MPKIGDFGLEPQTFGLLPDDRVPEELAKQWIFGAENGIIKRELMPDGNWLGRILKSNETQGGVYFDSMACVSFSLAKMCSMTFNEMIKQDFFLDEDIKWLQDNGYIDSFGEVNFSERALAKWSGTTRTGNSLWRVVDTARTMGLIPQSKWDFPSTQRTPVFDWDDYYVDTPQELYALGLEFTKRFPFFYEFVNTSDRLLLAKGRKYSPAQITVYAFPFPVNGIYPASDQSKNHAVVSLFDDEVEKIRYIGDSYEDGYTVGTQFFKKLAWNYSFGDGYVIYFTKPNTTPMKIENNILVQLVEGSGGFALALDGNLVIDELSKILATWFMRNGGNVEGKTLSLKQADWDLISKVNLKKEPIVS